MPTVDGSAKPQVSDRTRSWKPAFLIGASRHVAFCAMAFLALRPGNASAANSIFHGHPVPVSLDSNAAEAESPCMSKSAEWLTCLSGSSPTYAPFATKTGSTRYSHRRLSFRRCCCRCASGMERLVPERALRQRPEAGLPTFLGPHQPVSDQPAQHRAS